jgi:predicted dehydrogenase
VQKKTGISRREFIGGAAAAAAAFTIVPRHVLGGDAGPAPGSKVNLVCVGAGGQGAADLNDFSKDKGVNIVAICDVDARKDVADTFNKFPDAKKYKDFRKMFDETGKGFDAVICATPDHSHAMVSMNAIKRGKHVYCEQPLAHSVFECREVAKAAKASNVVTQLGNQGHASEYTRIFCEWIHDNAIGKVRDISLGSDAINSAIDQLPRLNERPPVPDTLDWDLWLGPVPPRPYHPAYHPYDWRGWVPFGGGTIGDWTCHNIDPVFWAFDLGAPASIQADVKNYDPRTQGDAFPKGDIITYEFAAKGDRGPITLKWHSGTEPLPRAADLEPERQMKDIAGIVIGANGSIVYGPHGASCRIVPEARMKAYKLPPKTIPRTSGGITGDFIHAIQNGTKACSDFSYGGPLSEIAMLGVIALKFPGTKLMWDGPNAKFTNNAVANNYVALPYRTGWTLGA